MTSEIAYLHERIDRLREQLRADFSTIAATLENLQRQLDALRHQNIPPK